MRVVSRVVRYCTGGAESYWPLTKATSVAAIEDVS